MPPIVKDLFLSKKFLVALFTAAGAVTAYKGWSVEPMTILLMASPFLIYIGAQGWADSGKEAAKIQSAAAIQLQEAAFKRDPAPLAARNSEAGFAKVSVMVLTAIASIFIGMALYSPLSMVGGCTHPGQSALHVGQCLLDDGVLAEVLAALAKPDYLKQVENVGLTHTGDLIDCALQAVATKPAVTKPATETHTLVAPPESDTLARRAREALAMRHASK